MALPTFILWGEQKTFISALRLLPFSYLDDRKLACPILFQNVRHGPHVFQLKINEHRQNRV